MGWLEGVLTGYANRHYEIEKDKRREAELAADREERVFNTLLNSKYKDIQDYAAAGMLDLSNPRRRKGGVAGWMGEVEQTPYLDMIKRARERIDVDPEYAQGNLREDYPGLGSRELGGTPPATPSVPSPAGSVPASSTAAQVSTSPVTGGQVTPVTPAPQSAPPPAPPPAAGAGPQAGPQAGAPAPPAPSAGPPFPISGAPPPPPGQVASGLPGATTQSVGAMPPVRPSRTQLPGIFPTASEAAMDAARARSAGTDLGEQDSYIRVAEAQGLTRKEGLAMWAEAQMKAHGGGMGVNTPYAWRTMEYTDPQGQKRRILARTNRASGQIEDVNGHPLPANATPVTPGNYPAEVAARRMASNPLLWNQALTQARSVLGLNATPEDVIDFADQLFTQSQSLAPPQPGAPGAAAGGTPGPTTSAPAPGGAPPAAAAPGAAAPGAAAPGAAVVPGATAPPVAPSDLPPTPLAPVPSHPAAPATPATPGAAVKSGLEAAGRPDLLDRTRDVGRPATSVERDLFGFYLRARQSLDAIETRDKTTGLSLEDRLAGQALGSQLMRRFTPDSLDFLLPADAQLYKTASERFTEARVRRVSGAQVRPDEYLMDRQIFFAQPGDTKERIAQKQRMREAEMDANVFAAGPAYNEYFKQPYAPKLQQDPNATQRLPPAMPPPPPNRSIPRPPGTPALVPSHTPQAAPPAPPGAAQPGVPTSIKGPDNKWYIVIQ